jgi:hypothetical protein
VLDYGSHEFPNLTPLHRTYFLGFGGDFGAGFSLSGSGGAAAFGFGLNLPLGILGTVVPHEVGNSEHEINLQAGGCS